MFTANKLQASHCPVHIKAQLRVYNGIYNKDLTATETVSSVEPSTGTKISPVMEIPQEYREIGELVGYLLFKFFSKTD